MKVWKDRSGKWVSGKEFSSRFMQGVEGITPLQQASSNLFGFFLVLIGILWGLYYSGTNGMWWLFVILLGSLFVSGTGALGGLQKYRVLKQIDLQMSKYQDILQLPQPTPQETANSSILNDNGGVK